MSFPAAAVLQAPGLAAAPSASQASLSASSDGASLTHRLAQLPLSFEAVDPGGDTPAAVPHYRAHGPGYSLLLSPHEAVMRLAPDGTDIRWRWQGAQAHPVMQGEGILDAPSHYFVGRQPHRWRKGVTQYKKVRYAKIYPGIDLLYYSQAAGHLEYDWIVAPYADPKRIQLAFGGQGLQSLRINAQGALVLTTPHGTVFQHQPVVYQTIQGQRRIIPSSYVRLGPTTVGFKLGAYDASQPLVIDPSLDYSTYLGGTNESIARAVAVDAQGNMYIAGGNQKWLTEFYPDFPMEGPSFQTKVPWAFKRTLSAVVAKFDAKGKLVYSTYLAGSSDSEATSIAVDAQGRMYVAGYTKSPDDFPVTPNALHLSKAGDGNAWSTDGFISVLSADGKELLYSTYWGGAHNDEIYGMAVSPDGHIYITGRTYSDDFPLFPVPDSSYPDDPTRAWKPLHFNDAYAFVTHLTPDGEGYKLAYSTYLGGSLFDMAHAIAIDAQGNAYIAGATQSDDFRLKNPHQPTHSNHQASTEVHLNGFVAKYAPNGELHYSTYLGGAHDDAIRGIAVDSKGYAYVTGRFASEGFATPGAYQQTPHGGGSDAFMARYSPEGKLLNFSYLGGSAYDEGHGISVDALGNVHVTGITFSNDFPEAAYLNADGTLSLHPSTPTPKSSSAAFVSRLRNDASQLDPSAILSGNGHDTSYSVATDARGMAYVAGGSYSSDLPMTLHAYQSFKAGPLNTLLARIWPQTKIIPLLQGPATSTQGQSVTFEAMLPSPEGQPLPTGQVTFMTDPLGRAKLLCTATLHQGQARCSSSNLSLGTHRIAAKYAGDASYLGSLSQLWVHTVYGQAPQPNPPPQPQPQPQPSPNPGTPQPVQTTTTLQGSSETSYVGDKVLFTAQVSKQADQKILDDRPLGKVRFILDNLSQICEDQELDQGQAACATEDLLEGNHQVVAYYLGQGVHQASQSDPLFHNVQRKPISQPKPRPPNHPKEPQKQPTHTRLEGPSQPWSLAGDKVNFTAYVSLQQGDAIPTGRVEFQADNIVALCSVPLEKGHATCASSKLQQGKHRIVAVYLADDPYEDSQSEAVDHEVKLDSKPSPDPKKPIPSQPDAKKTVKKSGCFAYRPDPMVAAMVCALLGYRLAYARGARMRRWFGFLR